ncbi:MAG: ligase-associated DNA damage response endonuclease PdeM [Paracoccaceae bacterium]
MHLYEFTLAHAHLQALPSGALCWPAENLLIVSDLHFGKSERLARRGGSLLPPYENRATLQKLDHDIERTNANRVLCLGDSFDDLTAADHIDDDDLLWLTRLMAGRDWLWVEGNHDAGPVEVGGTHLAEAVIAGLTFRHIASPETPEVSGHYHPKARLPGRTAPAFLIDAHRIILPAYGAYTGGLWCDHPDLTALMQPNALAVLTGTRCLVMPMRT